MHWPVAFASGDKLFPLTDEGVFKLSGVHFNDTWKAMEALLKTGKTKAIGVSNFNVRRLKDLLKSCDVKPTVNQIESHPYLQQQELVDFHKQHDILIEAYSPLGNNTTGEPKTMDDPVCAEVGKQLGMDPGQTCISWGVQRGQVVLPKSVTEKRIVSNFQDQVLPDWAMDKLNAMERHKRFNCECSCPLFTHLAESSPQVPGTRWGYDIFDEAGEDAVKKSAKESGPENLKKFTV